MSISKINTLLIGLGNIGCGYDYNINFEVDKPESSSKIFTHARAVTCHPSFNLIAGIDICKSARERFEVIYKNSTFDSIDSFLDHENNNIDFVIIAVHPKFQPMLIEEVIEKVCPRVLLIEKPIALSMEESRKVQSICKRKPNLIVCVNYIRRYLPFFLDWKKIIESKKLGEFLHGNIVYGKGLLTNGSHFLNLAQGWLGGLKLFKKLNEGLIYSDFDKELSFILQHNKNSFLGVYSLCSDDLRAGEVDLWFENGRVCLLNNGKSLYFWPRIKSNLEAERYDVLSEKPRIINTDILKYQYFVLVSIEKIFNIDVKVDLPCSIDDSIETMSLIDSVFSI